MSDDFENIEFETRLCYELNSYNYDLKYSIKLLDECYARVTFMFDTVEIYIYISFDEHNKILEIDSDGEAVKLTLETLIEQLFWRSITQIENLKSKIKRIKNM